MMNTFFRFFYEFISIFFDGIRKLFEGIIGGILKIFDYGEYKKILDSYTDSFGIMLEEYLFSGLSDFEKFDDIPITLKALLFNRYCKTAQSMLSAVEPFKKFYHKYYTDHQ